MIFLFAMLFFADQEIDPIAQRWADYAKKNRNIDHVFTLQAVIPLEENENGLMESAQSVRANQKYLYVRGHRDEPLQCFDRKGKWVRQIGGFGEGPGEYRTVASIEFAYEGNLALFDSFNSWILLFNPEGKFIYQTRRLENHETPSNHGFSFSWLEKQTLYFMNVGSHFNDPMIEVYEVKPTNEKIAPLSFLGRVGPSLGPELKNNFTSFGTMIAHKGFFYLGFFYQSELCKTRISGGKIETILFKNPCNITKKQYFEKIRGTKHEVLVARNFTAVTHDLFSFEDWIIVDQGNLGFNLLDPNTDTFLLKSNLRLGAGSLVGTTENELIFASRYSHLDQHLREILKKAHPSIDERFDNPILLLYTAKPELANEWLKRK